MAKKTKKTGRAPIITPVVTEVKPPAKWIGYFPYIITGVFFVLSLIGILNHEMWRDEYQAWMVAADAHSIPQLFQNLKYEGHPVLWHAFLYIISSFTDNPFGMQLLHILISTGFIFLINRYSPLTVIQKILLTFGYYTFYEYNLISRAYGLEFLLMVIFCVLYPQRHKYILWMGVVLFLLAEISIFGVMLAGCLAGIIFLEKLFANKKSKTPSISWSGISLFGVIFMIGIILGYLQIKPEPDNSFPTLYMTDFDMVRAKWSFSRLIHAYFPVPDFRSLHFWNKNFFVPDETKFAIGITPLLFLLWVIAFMRYRLILILYGLGTLLLILFYYYTGFIWARYAGHLFLLLIVCFWLSYYQKEKPFQNNLINRLSLFGNKIRVPFFMIILSVSFIGGVVTYAMDLVHPFSTSEQASAYIKENNLQDLEIIGSRDYVISPLASQLDKKIFYAERKEPGSFIIYDQVRTNIWSFSEVQETLTQKWNSEHKSILLVKDFPILMTFQDNGESIPWEDAPLTETLNMKFLKSIDPGIVEDERYFIYLIEEIK